MKAFIRKCSLIAIATFIALPLYFSFHQPEGFKVAASVEGIPNNSIVYLKMGSRVVDSTEIIDGEFTFTGVVDIPQIVQLRIPKTGDYKAFWLENTTISIEAESGLFKYAEIRGSLLQLEQDQLDAELTFYMNKADSIAYLLRDKSLESEERKEIYQELQGFKSNMWKVHEKFIREHPSSWVSVVNLMVVVWRMGGEKAAELLNILDKDLQNTKYGKEIQHFISLNINPQVGDKFADFVQENTRGDSVRFSQIEGKVRLLEFWASWCGPCRTVNAKLVKLYDRFHEKGLEIVGIGLEKNKNKWLEAIKEDQLPWINLTDLNFGKNEAAMIYSVGSIPDNVLIDDSGLIVGRKLTIAQLEKYLIENLE